MRWRISSIFNTLKKTIPFLILLVFSAGCGTKKRNAAIKQSPPDSQIGSEQSNVFREILSKKYAEFTQNVTEEVSGLGDLIIEKQNEFLHNVKEGIKKTINSGKIARNHIHRIQEIKRLDNEAKSFTESLLSHSDPLEQFYALPILIEIYRNAPDSREWVIEQLKKKINTTSGRVRTAWSQALKTISA